MTMKAAAGPPIWNRLPPSAEMTKPATTAVINPLSGVVPAPIAIAIDSGKARMATVKPASASWRRASASYPELRAVTSFGVKSLR
jgi:hypothetical protein